MENNSIKMVVFDMAGTTVIDNHEVLQCFSEACYQDGIIADSERLNALMGVSKLEVFQVLWREQLGKEAEETLIVAKARQTFSGFRTILEDYYRLNEVSATEGAYEAFNWLRARDIKIVLNTGFYRVVTNIILNKLGWLAGLDSNYVGGVGSIINLSIASDEVPLGRPKPYMIQKAMGIFGIEDPRHIVKIGDTPVDLAEGRNAGCLLSLAVTNGTHHVSELEVLDNDGLLGSLKELPVFLTPYL